MTLIYISIVIIILFAFFMVMGGIFSFFDDGSSFTLSLPSKTVELDCYQPLFSTDFICTETGDKEIEALLKECKELREESRLLMEKSKIRKLPG